MKNLEKKSWLRFWLKKMKNKKNLLQKSKIWKAKMIFNSWSKKWKSMLKIKLKQFKKNLKGKSLSIKTWLILMKHSRSKFNLKNKDTLKAKKHVKKNSKKGPNLLTLLLNLNKKCLLYKMPHPDHLTLKWCLLKI